MRINVSIGCLEAHHSTNIMSLIYLPFTPVRLQQARKDINNNDNYMYNNNNTCTHFYPGAGHDFTRGN